MEERWERCGYGKRGRDGRKDAWTCRRDNYGVICGVKEGRNGTRTVRNRKHVRR